MNTIQMMRYLFLLLLFSACGETETPKKHQYTTQQVKDLSVQMNTWDEKRQNDEINQYLKVHNWEMEKTKSGLRYMMIEEGKGEFAKRDQHAKVAYKIFLLDGTLCYSAEKDSAKTIHVGKDYVESGLHEGIQLMKVGAKMRFILPSHLAHGLTGDQSKIPPLSSVVYEIELLGLSDTK